MIFVCLTLGTCKNDIPANTLSELNEDFDEFLIKFDNDSIFQFSRIKFPLKIENFTNINYDFETLSVDEKEWDFHKGEITVRKIIIEREIINKTYIKLHTQVSDTDIYVIYCFENFDGKWYLVKGIDKSL